MLACVCFFRRPRETWLRWYAQQHMPSWFLRKLQGSLHGHEPEFLPHLWPHCCGGGLSGGHIAHSESAMIGGVSGKCLPPLAIRFSSSMEGDHKPATASHPGTEHIARACWAQTIGLTPLLPPDFRRAYGTCVATSRQPPRLPKVSQYGCEIPRSTSDAHASASATLTVTASPYWCRQTRPPN